MALPTNPIASYFPYWNPVRRLSEWTTTFNVIFLFKANPANGEAVGGDTGAVVFNSASGSNQFTGAIATNLNADIATCRARGQKILISVGGAGGQVYLQTKARADAFIASIKTINEGLGGSGTTAAIDGIDFNNFEGANITGQATWMTYIGQELKAFYGSDFLITAPPSADSSGSPSQVSVDRALLAEMYAGGALDWMCPQIYDGPATTIEKMKSTLDLYNTEVTVNGSPVTLPRNIMGAGFGIQTPTWTDSRYWTSASAAATAYTTLVNDGYTPKGTFNWAMHLDPTGLFPAAMASVVTNNVEPLSPKFELVASTNFADGDATTARLTAPAGKTSGSDFQAGKMAETSNPISGFDLGSGKYTELEWCLQATTDAVDAATYEFRVTYDGAQLDTYSVTPEWTIGTPLGGDSTAPTVPTNLVATAVSDTQIALTWTPSTDTVGVTGYNIYRDDVLIDTSPGASYTDTGLTASTLYAYKVSAFDAAGNTSAQSTEDSATTDASAPADSTPPTVSQTSGFEFTDGQTIFGTVTFRVTATDPSGIVYTYVEVDGNQVASDSIPSYRLTWNTNSLPDGTYAFTFHAVDGFGNIGSTSAINLTIANGGTPGSINNPPVVTGISAITGLTTINI